MTTIDAEPKARTVSVNPPSLLDLRSASPERIVRLLTAARGFDTDAPPAPPTGLTVANLFFEDSTRTRVSFSIAAHRIGVTPLELDMESSSRSKGETLDDTARTIAAMGVDAMVVRSREPGGPAIVGRAVGCPVISAGDGRHEHPTQGLLDAYTVAEAHGLLGSFDLAGLRVAVVGDAANSRVARSDVAAFTKLGAEVVVVGPPSMAPASLAALGCEVSEDFDGVIGTIDAVQMLRVQRERGGATGSLRSYTMGYQLTPEREARMKDGAIVMHPGPMNRGVEIHPDAADGERSRIERQVSVGVLVRMAALSEALGGAA